MHAIYLLLNLCFNCNIKFKFELYSDYIKIVHIIIEYLFINQYVYNKLESLILNLYQWYTNNLRHNLK